MDNLSKLDILKWYDYMGVETITAPSFKAKKARKKAEPVVGEEVVEQQITTSTLPISEILLDAQKIASSCKTVAELKDAVNNFHGLSIRKFANNTVFSDGVESAEVMVIGEAPGAQEDAKGIPFCGDSGELLDNMLKAIDLSRQSNTYITNVIFWRPPGNRKPEDEEIAICMPFLKRHIELVNPKLILLFGATACNAVIGQRASMTSLRQKIHKYGDINVLANFHPSYLMRQPSQKKQAWHDLLLAKKIITENNIKI